ncbi:MAG TPA: glutamine amidotransferase, partial [Novosphingobium sp.]|nr:glutamine amidotransferase [Novosphingobium sp.]
MCGIVGLFLKDPALEPQLGKLLADMLVVMTGRGPDSAGFAVYGAGDAAHLKITLRGANLDAVEKGLAGIAKAHHRDTHLVLSFPASAEGQVRGWLALNHPDLVVTGSGHRIELYKEVGL